MVIDIVMPKMGESITEGTILAVSYTHLTLPTMFEV